MVTKIYPRLLSIMFPNIILTAWDFSFVIYVSAAPRNVHGQPFGSEVAPCPTQPSVPKPTQPPLRVYQSCGGKRVQPFECDEGFECLDDPRNEPSCGMACDEPGICISKSVQYCGGYPGIFDPCPEGYRCYDNPNDGCDPYNFGADCPGICL